MAAASRAAAPARGACIVVERHGGEGAVQVAREEVGGRVVEQKAAAGVVGVVDVAAAATAVLVLHLLRQLLLVKLVELSLPVVVPAELLLRRVVLVTVVAAAVACDEELCELVLGHERRVRVAEPTRVITLVVQVV